MSIVGRGRRRGRRLGILAWAGLSLASGAHGASVWAVQGAHNTVYLAASVHVLRPGDTLPAAFDRAYADSRSLMMEIDLSNLNPEAGATYVLEHGMLPEGQTLRSVLGAARYGRLEQEAGRLGLPLEGLQQLEPWTVALTLTQLELAKLGLDPDAGVERQLERRAATDKKPIQGLETLEQQLQLLSGMSLEDQARFLDLSASEGDETDSQSGEILVAWRAGNEHALEQLLKGEYQAFPELYQRLVTDRNHHWIAPIAELLRADQNTMVVVGALHLVGSEGVVALLRHKGYVVRPID